MRSFAELLAAPGVTETARLGGPIGVMAYHGGTLEAMTDVIATRVADLTGASLYTVVQTAEVPHHLPSTRVDPAHSERLAAFLDHVSVAVTIHGYGRRGRFGSLLLGGRNRRLAEHVGAALRRGLPAYEIVTELDEIPRELRGMHERNPVNLPASAGVQIELPPRVRGSSPLWWDWEHDRLTPHTESLIDGLAEAIGTWDATRDRARTDVGTVGVTPTR